MLPDWHLFHAHNTAAPAVVDSRRRLRICLVVFVFLLLVVFSRALQLEVTQGAAFRREAARPLMRENHLPGVRGRILAADGTVLAYDKNVPALAVHYRYLQQPPDPDWLRRTVRSRLTKAQRKDPDRVTAEMDRVGRERSDSARRLAELCGLSTEDWNRRAGRIQTRVERIARGVSRRRGREIAIAEERDYHVMAEGLPLAVVAEIEGHAGRYPGVKIAQHRRRAYPSGSLAAHVLGHLGPIPEEGPDAQRAGYRPDDLVGRMGLERQYEELLRGRNGSALELTDRSGRVLSAHHVRQPGVGQDIVLSLDSALQRAAETLLDRALARRAIDPQRTEPAGGAIVVMDVRSGALRAVAAAPRFDPNVFVDGRTNEVSALLTDTGHPLFDRACRMAIPPGSVFKTISAAALLEATAADPHAAFYCQGYLHHPDRQRCAIYRRHGTGHGEITLFGALAQSCNVYFFHHAGELGPGPVVYWAGKFGFGSPTGVDLPGEAAGVLPSPETISELEGHAWRPGDTQLLAIGQGSLTATPLQVVRMMAAVANGGRLLTPHVVSRLGLPELAEGESLPEDWGDSIRIPPARPIAGLTPRTLEVIREGLQRVVSDPDGTAHGTVRLDTIAIAGKTGTAQTGPDRGDHAWFAGYVPAEKPRFALVIALEHSGDAAVAAGPVARYLVLQMQKLGML